MVPRRPSRLVGILSYADANSIPYIVYNSWRSVAGDKAKDPVHGQITLSLNALMVTPL